MRSRGHEDSRGQPNVDQGTSQTTREGASSAAPEDIETHEMTRIQAVSGGGVTVNESLCVQETPHTRGAPIKGNRGEETGTKEGDKGADI